MNQQDEYTHAEPMMSESIAELAKALCEVQKTELFALTTSKNPFFKSKYADLSSVWEAIREPLTANGLSVVQTTEPVGKIVNTDAKVSAMSVLFPSLGDDWKKIDLKDFKARMESVNRLFDEGLIIVTTLMHKSGEWIRGRLLLKPDAVTPQGFGSAITYGRRYALAAIIGISPEDDDGEKAMNREKKKQSTQKPPPKEGDPEIKSADKVCKAVGEMKDPVKLQSEQGRWNADDHSDYSDEDAERISKAFETRIAVLSAGNSDKKITTAQAKRLYAIGSQCKPTAWTHDAIKAHVKEKYGWDTAKDLTVAQYNEVEKFIGMNEAEEPHIVEDLDKELAEGDDNLITSEQRQQIYDAGRQQDVKMVHVDGKIVAHFEITDIKKLRQDQFDEAIKLFE